MVEGARLESECALTGTVGSNPTLSAKTEMLTDGAVGSPCHAAGRPGEYQGESHPLRLYLLLGRLQKTNPVEFRR